MQKIYDEMNGIFHKPPIRVAICIDTVQDGRETEREIGRQRGRWRRREGEGEGESEREGEAE